MCLVFSFSGASKLRVKELRLQTAVTISIFSVRRANKEYVLDCGV